MYFPNAEQRQTAYYNMACVLVKLEKFDAAFEKLEEALSEGFDDYDL